MHKTIFMSAKITNIQLTNEKISARGGLPLVLRYIENIGLYELVSSIILKFVFRSGKGLQLYHFLKQMIAYLIDGTNTSISGFDQLKKEEAYAAL